MGLFSGPRRAVQHPENREFTMPSSYPVPQLTYAGISPNGEGALRSIAVGAATSLISTVCSELPIDVFRGRGSDRREVPFPGWLEDPGGDDVGIEDWLYQLFMSWLYRGNAYGRVTLRDRSGSPIGIAWFNPDDVRPVAVDGRLSWTVKGRPFEPVEDFVHLPVGRLPGHLLGRSPIEQHATQIGISLSSSQYGAQWFLDGAHPSALLVNSEATIDQGQAKTIKARWLELFRGTREPAVFGKGWDYKPLQITPEESQFLETQRFSEAQCARIFGPAMAETLGYETGGSMTYANVQERRSDLLALNLNNWMRRADRLISKMLPRPQYARLNRDAFMESTTLARFESHGKALADRWRTVNEVRRIEDLPPVPWGDAPNDKTSAQQTVGGN